MSDLATILQDTHLRYHVKNMREFTQIIYEAMTTLEKNKWGGPVVKKILDAFRFCHRVDSVGGRPVLETDIGDLYLGPSLGMGSFNRVRTAMLNGEEVVVRTTLRKPSTGTKSVLIFAVEAAIHAILSGEKGIPRFIAPFKAVKSGEIEVGMITEYIHGKELCDVMASSRMTDEMAFYFMIKVFQILVRLDNKYGGFIHRDLRGDNILVSNDLKSVYIIDFGLAYLPSFGLDCNTDCTFVSTEHVPKCIDTLVLLWTITDDCRNLRRDCPLFTALVDDLLKDHNSDLSVALPEFNKMDADTRWYQYQRHFAYKTKDDPRLYPEAVLKRLMMTAP